MEALGARVLVLQSDISRHDDVSEVMARIDALGAPLRGIVHAAAVVADHTVLELSEAELLRVLEPKLLGAFHLHVATLGRELDFFLLYSSVAGLLGSSGQANYSAANTALDALAFARRAKGLTATSVLWGPFSDVGLAAAHQNRGARLALRGLDSLTPEEGLSVIPRLISTKRAEISVTRFDSRRWLEAQPQAASSPFFAELRKERGITSQVKATAVNIKAELEAKPESERYGVLEGMVREQISKVLRIEPARIDMSAALTGLGMDSLTSIELRNHLETATSLKLSATLLFTYATGAALTAYLLGRILPKTEQPRPVAAEHAEGSKTAPDKELPHDDDLLAAFDASMTSIKEDGLL
jgi:acyl carrier protein/short-subunit dehydrogenase